MRPKFTSMPSTGAFAMPRVATVSGYPLMSAPAPAVPWLKAIPVSIWEGKFWGNAPGTIEEYQKWLHSWPLMKSRILENFRKIATACLSLVRKHQQLRWRTLLPKLLRRKCEDQFLDWAAVRLLTILIYVLGSGFNYFLFSPLLE